MEFDEMKDRIAHIIRAKNLTAAEFAMRLGIQPSNVSHLLAGRNNPSLDFVKKLKETFPEYNLDWIVLGKGPMTVSEPFPETALSAESMRTDAQEVDNHGYEMGEALFSIENIPSEAKVNNPYPIQKDGLKRIVLVFEDDTFEVLLPR